MSHLLSYLAHLKISRHIDDGQVEPDPPGAAGQPQIADIDLTSDTDAQITVDCPAVENAEWIEWWAGSNAGPDRWVHGSPESPIVSFTMDEVVFDVPRQPSVNDSSFFCYRGANNVGSGSHSCNGFTIPSQPPTEPGEITAPTINSLQNQFVSGSPRVLVNILPGQNAVQHDVHRVQGDVPFDAGSGNLIAEGIGQAPSLYTDQGVQPTTAYSYRVVSRDASNALQSNRQAITTLGEPVGGDYPNLPSNFQTTFQHDNSSLPVPGSTSPFNASGAGRISFSTNWGNDGNDGGVFTGVIPSSAFVQGPRMHDGVPTVMHGPLAPHGQEFVHRVRYSNGQQGNTSIPCNEPGHGAGGATGGTSQCGFRAAPSDILLRAWYIHFWVLFEGFHYVSPVDGPTRVIATGSQYRMAFQRNNNDVGCNNQGGLFGLGNSGGATMRGRDADTGTIRQVTATEGKMTHTALWHELGTVNVPLGEPATLGLPGNPDALGNSRSATNVKWVIADGAPALVSGSPRSPLDVIRIGKWEQIEFLGFHSDVNVMNGSVHMFVNGIEVASMDPIVTRRSNFAGPCVGSTNPADGFYLGPDWYRGYHPVTCARARWVASLGGHARYACFADYFMAGIPA